MDTSPVSSVTARIGQILALAGQAQAASAPRVAAPPAGAGTVATSAFGTQLARAQAAPAATAPTAPATLTRAAPAGASDADLAAHLDRWITARTPSSPLAGHGAVFVAAGRANGVDPRLLVAIAAQESGLGTAGSGRDIHNAFGWGPAIPFASWEEGIHRVAAGLRRGYLADGLDTIAEIQGRYAPVGASNDPGGLNGGWAAGVSRLYAELGGDPAGSVATADGTSPTR